MKPTLLIRKTYRLRAQNNCYASETERFATRVRADEHYYRRCKQFSIRLRMRTHVYPVYTKRDGACVVVEPHNDDVAFAVVQVVP